MKKRTEPMTLTKGEMEIMNLLWNFDGEATIKDILDRCDEPKPAYTTVATFLKILYQKGFISQEKHPTSGKTYFYRPLMTREEYTSRVMDDVTTSFFVGSVKSLVNFFVKAKKISTEEVEELLKKINSTHEDSALK